MDVSLDKALDQLLGGCCSEPRILKDAISRIGLHTVSDFHPGDVICREGDLADACWLILEDGSVEIQRDSSFIKLRKAGELVGEQAFLKALKPKGKATRTATMIARSNVRLFRFDAALQERMTAEERATWFLALASVVNDKLEEATAERAQFQRIVEQRDTLLSRFADDEPLGIVKRAIENDPASEQTRDAIVWFSDLAGFSGWARGKPVTQTSSFLRDVLAAQIDAIREAGGTIDKLMGDGLMAFWFVDTEARRQTNPSAAVTCALKVAGIVQAMIAARSGGPSNIRIGLHTGPVAFGDFGARARIAVTILGETVNLGSRYEQAKSAELGSVRISPELHSLAALAKQDLSMFRGPIAAQVKDDKFSVYTI